jgi:hypothetical protein
MYNFIRDRKTQLLMLNKLIEIILTSSSSKNSPIYFDHGRKPEL